MSVQIGMAASYWSNNFAAGGNVPKELPENIQKMLLGIQKYHMHEYKRPEMSLDEIWRKGEVSISCIPGHEYVSGNEAILLVPSLINKSYIFDLNEQRSLLRWLSDKDINPYLLSWGEPTEDAGQNTMEGVVLDRLVPALQFLTAHNDKPIHALGYCMGGTLLAAAASQNSVSLKSTTLLAAPWDFHAGTQALLNRVKFWAPSAFPAIEEKGTLGMDWIQTVFASLDPSVATRKFSNFCDMAPNSNQEKLFVAVEDWLNDGVDLPGEVAQHCISEWFIKNTPASGEWMLKGSSVKPENISCPVLIIASGKDRLVEYETAAILEKKIKSCEVINPSCGHIGVIAGQQSIQNVWEPLADWIKR